MRRGVKLKHWVIYSQTVVARIILLVEVNGIKEEGW
jgi:hypothetical protein